MKDLQKELDRFIELWSIDDNAVDVANFAHDVLPEAIDRALKAEDVLKKYIAANECPAAWPEENALQAWGIFGEALDEWRASHDL